jgi:hypothetical protein
MALSMSHCASYFEDRGKWGLKRRSLRAPRIGSFIGRPSAKIADGPGSGLPGFIFILPLTGEPISELRQFSAQKSPTLDQRNRNESEPSAIVSQ